MKESFAGAAVVAGQIGGAAGAGLLSSAQQAFVDAMSFTCLIGVVFALAGLTVAAVFLPARVNRSMPSDGDRLVADSA